MMFCQSFLTRFVLVDYPWFPILGVGGGVPFFSVGCRCPWTGTGIGRKNMLAFKVFVVGVNVLCYFSVILVIVALLYGLRKGK